MDPDPASRTPVDHAVEHIVIVMMENRSFDHALGYLGREGPLDPQDPQSTVDGLGEEEYEVVWDGTPYKTFPLGTTKWEPPRRDPPHDGRRVGWQATDPARYPWAYRDRHGGSHADLQPGDVLGYLTADEVPIYDFLARRFCVCDKWFCSVPGETWPNRMFALAGTAGGEVNIPETVLEGMWGKHSFFRDLERTQWRWYSSDPALLRAVDDHFRFDDNAYDNFAYFDQCTDRQETNFVTDALGGNLRDVSWVDPNFFKVGDMPGQHPNSDHPPLDVARGQKFVHTVYEALRRSKRWERTLLIITYDEHGGFYDHVRPDPPVGPRVPGLVVSPWVKPGRPCHVPLEHTAIAKTVLRRFLWKDANPDRRAAAIEKRLEDMGPRVYSANDVWHMLEDASPDWEPTGEFGPPVLNPGVGAIVEDDLSSHQLEWPASTLQSALQAMDDSWSELADLQRDLLLIFVQLRRTGPRWIVRPLGKVVRFLHLGRLLSWLTKPAEGRRRMPDRSP
jgi:phospholipase C